MIRAHLIEIVCAAIFGLAVLHTFATKYFVRLGHINPRHAGLWHLLGEVEIVFGFWALVLVLAVAILSTPSEAIAYIEGQNFTEPLFVFVILVVAGSRPILYFARRLVNHAVRLIPLQEPVAFYLLILTIIPLFGSFITEPAAMTLAALMLRDRYFTRHVSGRLKYATLAVLLVNVSIGGTLTAYAAPPVLMVAAKWNWDTCFMMTTFGWKAAIAVCINAVVVTFLFRKSLASLSPHDAAPAQPHTPMLVIAVHLIFLFGIVVFSHHPVVFMGLFLFFLGYTEAYSRHQDPLLLREGLLVAFSSLGWLSWVGCKNGGCSRFWHK